MYIYIVYITIYTLFILFPGGCRRVDPPLGRADGRPPSLSPALPRPPSSSLSPLPSPPNIQVYQSSV